jgi:hypothetical protein
MKSFGSIRVFNRFKQFAIGNRNFIFRRGNVLLGNYFIIGKIIRRKPKMGFFGFALCPNLRRM